MKARGPHKSPAVPIRVGYLPLQQHVGFCDACTLPSKCSSETSRETRGTYAVWKSLVPHSVQLSVQLSVQSLLHGRLHVHGGVLPSMWLDYLRQNHLVLEHQLEPSCSLVQLGDLVWAATRSRSWWVSRCGLHRCRSREGVRRHKDH